MDDERLDTPQPERAAQERTETEQVAKNRGEGDPVVPADDARHRPEPAAELTESGRQAETRQAGEQFGEGDPVVPVADRGDRPEQLEEPFHSRYADGTLVREGHEPDRIHGPHPDAEGAHSVLRWDDENGRIYQAREYDADGHPVRDIDFTNPTDPRGREWPGHPGPPHQHRWVVNDPEVGPRSNFKRIRRAEPSDA
jgi:hypothetical protein